MNRVFIRALTLSDLASMHAIEVQAHQHPWSHDALKSSFSKHNMLLGIFVDNALAGYLIAQVVLDEACVLNLCVAPKLHGRGYGNALLECFLTSIAAAPKITQCYLEVRASNGIAQSLYAKHGFEQTGRRTNYYSKPSEDAVLMTHTLCA